MKKALAILLAVGMMLSMAAYTSASDPDVDYLDWWNGDWYGWRVVTSGHGDFEDVGGFYDVLATIELNKDLEGSIVIWDYDEDQEDYFARADVELVDGATYVGRLVSKTGDFLGEEFGLGAWIVDPGDAMSRDVEHMICIRGVYQDPDDEDSWMIYYFFLRPWGMTWDDMEDIDLQDTIWGDLMPGDYDWYLEQIGEQS